MIDGNKVASAGFAYLGTPYSVMDCQAFVERCLKDAGWTIDLAGSNAWYRLCHQEGEVLTPAECVKKYGTTPPGAFLFIHANDGGEPEKYKGDGLGNASHIGIVTGTGEGAIHSSASRGCVCESKYRNKAINGGWNKVGLLPEKIIYAGVAPSPDPSPDPAPDPKPTPVDPVYRYVTAENGSTVKMRALPSTGCGLYWDVPIGERVECTGETKDNWAHIKWGNLSGWMMERFLTDATPEDIRPLLATGDKGAYVTLAQTMLIQRGYDCGAKGADGKFGNDTYNAVRNFQFDHGLPVDGVIGQATWAALEDVTPATKYTVTIPHLSKSQADALFSQYPGSIMTEERG